MKVFLKQKAKFEEERQEQRKRKEEMLDKYKILENELKEMKSLHESTMIKYEEISKYQREQEEKQNKVEEIHQEKGISVSISKYSDHLIISNEPTLSKFDILIE